VTAGDRMITNLMLSVDLEHTDPLGEENGDADHPEGLGALEVHSFGHLVGHEDRAVAFAPLRAADGVVRWAGRTL
jgi:hypothetical protein